MDARLKREFLSLAALCLLMGAAPLRADEAPCKPYSFEDNAYTLCNAPLSRFSVRMFLRGPDGAPYSYLSALPKTDASGARLAFAFNGGMFTPDYAPVGLYIEDGRELVRANTKAGPGNFHLKPNGVFYASEDEAGVMETGAFLKKKPKALFATQSGPMLVIDGKLHPRIAKAHSSAKARDGVCIGGDGAVRFAISEGEVPFDTFERLFRDGLKCRNALFLDGGSAPALLVPGSRGGNSLLGLGPLIAVYERPRP